MGRLNPTRLLVGAAVLVIVATGCGDEGGTTLPAPTKTGEPAGGDHVQDAGASGHSRRGGAFGYYAFRYRGARGIALIPATARDDARIAEIDTYRLKAGIPTIGYTVVDIDNTHGSSGVAVAEVTVLPVKGPNWEADTGPDEVLTLWKAPKGVVNRYSAGARVDGVAVGHRGSVVLLSEFPLNEVPREVLVSLGDEQAIRATLVRETRSDAGGVLGETGK